MDLLSIQKNSVKHLLNVRIPEYIKSHNFFREPFRNNTLEFIDCLIENPDFTYQDCLTKKITFANKLKVQVLVNGSDKKLLYMADIPRITDRGSFVIDGFEKVIVSQLRLPSGIYFWEDKKAAEIKFSSGRSLFVCHNKKVSFTLYDKKISYKYVEDNLLNKESFNDYGREIFNKKFNCNIRDNIFTKSDLNIIIKYLEALNDNLADYFYDEFSDLGNWIVITPGDQIFNAFKEGFDRVCSSLQNNIDFPVNTYPLQSSIDKLFKQSSLCQFMDQTNPLSMLTHARRVSFTGPAGLNKKTKNLDIRNTQNPQYGKLCPIETPEGINIGLVLSLALCSDIDKNNHLTAPYFKVIKEKVTKDVSYLNAKQEEKFCIVHSKDEIDVNTDYIDISKNEMLSPSASLIPFLQHNDSNRALMGCNMQRQAVPLMTSQAPYVKTGMEEEIIKSTNSAVFSSIEGKVTYVDANKIVIGNTEYPLIKFERSNQSCLINYKPRVIVGDYVYKGDLIADGPCCDAGELSLGKNVLTAYMLWHGYTFEDAIVVSERLVNDDVFTSIHIDKYEASISSYGDYVDVIEDIIKVGSDVSDGDILIKKNTPINKQHLSLDEKLLNTVYDRDYSYDSSVKVSHYGSGKVIKVEVFDREKGDCLPNGINKHVNVYIAKKRKLQVGDKLAGRYGNKGVISKILPIEDMPYMEDGTPIDVIMNPLGVPSRMNIGQLFESAASWSKDFVASAFNNNSEEKIKNILKKEPRVDNSGKAKLRDGITGELFEEPITIGWSYVLKLNHMVEDKIHARSTGKYSITTQQPLAGRANFGGQRIGEMEMHALLAHGASYTLQEMFTIKSDDVEGRYDLLYGDKYPHPHLPKGFSVALGEMRGLCLNPVIYGKGRPRLVPKGSYIKTDSSEKKVSYESQYLDEGLKILDKVVKRLTNHYNGYTYNELYSIGADSMLKALHDFDSNKGKPLENYLTKTINLAVYDYVSQVKAPFDTNKSLNRHFKKIRNATAKYKQKYYDNPSFNNLSEETGLSAKVLNETLYLDGAINYATSFDMPAYSNLEEDSYDNSEAIGEHKTLEEHVQDEIDLCSILKAINKLNQDPKNKAGLKIFLLHLGVYKNECWSFSRLGKLFNMSKQAANKQFNTTLANIRKNL